MKTGMIAFSEKGFDIGEKLLPYFKQQGDEAELTRCADGELARWTQQHFHSCGALVFIGACAIAVRAIAPYIESKASDPPVVVLDELGSFSIPILSGHLGGANELSLRIAKWLGAVPVITTATDIKHVFAVDSWARAQGLAVANPERIKWVSARLLAGDTVRLKSVYPIEGALPAGIEQGGSHYDILISHSTLGGEDALRLVPPTVTLGIGCKAGISFELIEDAYRQLLKKAFCHPAAVSQVCSIDRKADEPGILDFCRRHGLPYHSFTAQELSDVPGSFSASAFVQAVTGVDNVCERSAVLGSGGSLLTKKEAAQGITMALALKPYTVSFGAEEVIAI